MSATESKEDFLAFRGLLDTLECLVNIRDKFPGWPSHFTKTIEDCIVHTAGRLTELDVNTSEFNAFEELERLATIKPKIKAQNQTRRLHYDNQLDDKHLFDTLIDSKIDFIKKGSFGRLTRGAGVGPLAALESLAEVTTKLGIYNGMNELLTSKMKEVVYAPEPQASLRNAPVALAQSTTGSSASLIVTPIIASHKQESPGSEVPIDFEDSTTTEKFASSPLSWSQEQYKVHTKDGDDSTEDGGALTPTSTIMSGKPDY